MVVAADASGAVVWGIGITAPPVPISPGVDVRRAAHRDAPGNGLGEAGDEDCAAPRIRGGHSGDDTERDEEAVLGAEDELAHA